jgi:hypothetical protein
MPYFDELNETLKFTRARGQKPFGHWDHDAKAVIGPPARPELNSDAKLPSTAPRSDEQGEAVVYQQQTEPRTGELILIVPQSRAGECSS